MKSLKIAFITPEALPFVKTGGLADISGTLPHLLSAMGHSVRMILPLYRQIKSGNYDLNPMGVDIECTIGGKRHRGEIYRLKDKEPGMEILFIRNDFFFDREELYRDVKTGTDYDDNDERFIFFSRGLLEGLKKTGWVPDILHANDWQASLVAAYLKTVFKDDSFFSRSKSLLTIHNLAYQGQFPSMTFEKIGVENGLFAPAGPFEYWGKVNFLKSGIVFADHISTVSPTYAEEIQTSSDYGMGLEGVIRDRANDLSGILNGVDYSTWSPKVDKLIPYRYSPANLSGKKKNKLELLNRANLPLRNEDPLVGMISRLDNQKGFDLLEAAMEYLMNLRIQMVLLGTGDMKYHDYFRSVQSKYPDKFRVFLEFDNKLAHLIEAGADIFLMPSRYEPCGLNQMYSLKYGTVPLVRKTGGLADTVMNFDEISMKGNGFVFEKYDAADMIVALKRAIGLYGQKRIWHRIIKQGMAQDFSWDSSAQQYEKLYFKLASRVPEGVIT